MESLFFRFKYLWFILFFLFLAWGNWHSSQRLKGVKISEYIGFGSYQIRFDYERQVFFNISDFMENEWVVFRLEKVTERYGRHQLQSHDIYISYLALTINNHEYRFRLGKKRIKNCFSFYPLLYLTKPGPVLQSKHRLI